jgi:hypothetical protein
MSSELKLNLFVGVVGSTDSFKLDCGRWGGGGGGGRGTELMHPSLPPTLDAVAAAVVVIAAEILGDSHGHTSRSAEGLLPVASDESITDKNGFFSCSIDSRADDDLR